MHLFPLQNQPSKYYVTHAAICQPAERFRAGEVKVGSVGFSQEMASVAGNAGE